MKKMTLGMISLVMLLLGADAQNYQNGKTNQVRQKVSNSKIIREKINVNGVILNMIRVEGGTFWMGSNVDDAHSAKPEHQVTLSAYYIGETEVTQELWLAVMNNNPSVCKGGKLPVENVSWEDCQEFLKTLYSLTNRKFRLPSEAEWEFAAKGGKESRGYKYSGSNNIDEVAWYDDGSAKKTWYEENTDMVPHPVKTKKANELGIFDMTGNVDEWCQDWKGEYNSDIQKDPKGPSTGIGRICRGGSYLVTPWGCQVFRRQSKLPSYKSRSLGLRLVL